MLFRSLFRLARSAAPGRQVNLARGLLAALVVTGLAPGGLYLLQSPWNDIYVAVQMIVRVAVLVYLVAQTRRDAAPSFVPVLAGPRRAAQPGLNGE